MAAPIEIITAANTITSPILANTGFLQIWYIVEAQNRGTLPSLAEFCQKSRGFWIIFWEG